MFRVLTLSTLFPSAARPTLGLFVERQVLALAARAGVAVRVVAPIGLPPLGRHFARYRDLAALPLREEWRGVTVDRPRFVHLPGPLARFDAGAYARAVVPLLTEIRRTFAFDVIDASFFWPDGPAAVALGRRFGVPVSIKARGADIHHWGHAAGIGAQVAEAGRAADGLLAVSGALKADMVALGMLFERIAVHYTGIDRAVFHVRNRAAAKAELGITGPLIVAVGALIARKGQRFIIEALPALPGVTLALIGHGEDEAGLRALAARLVVADRVRFLGSRPPSEIAQWLGAAEAMVLPSASEGLANAWVEALACGTPVVTCDVGGARELIDRPAAGALVGRDAGAIAEAVLRLIAEPPDREEVASTVARLGWEANAAELERHLRGLLYPAHLTKEVREVAQRR